MHGGLPVVKERTFGWSGRILRIDLSNRQWLEEPSWPYASRFIGGRGINVKIAFDEVEPTTSAFASDNRLLVGVGVLAGTAAPSASRTQLTAVLPNGLLASSGIGGFIGSEIRYAGYDNIVIQGRADDPVYVYIHDDGVEFKDARHIWGRDTQETQQIIRREAGDPDTQVMCIGPAGENLVSFSCVVTGMGNAAGHGGFGAIMGSKNLKAVAVRGKRAIDIASLDTFLEKCLETSKVLKGNPACQAMIASGGRTNAPDAVRAGVATFGNLEEIALGEDVLNELTDNGVQFWKRYKVGRTGCAGCPMHHFQVFNVPGIGMGAPKCAAWGGFATTIWNTDYELMFQAGTLCNRYGLDFVSTANIIAFLTDIYYKGIIAEQDTDGIAMRRGSREAIISTINKIARQEGFGKALRDGLLKYARIIGKGAEEFVLQVKDREMPIQEVRAFKGSALAFAVCKDPLDAIAIPELIWSDTTKEMAEQLAFALCGEQEAAKPDSYGKKADLVWVMENRITATEMLGLCKWYLLYVTPFLDVPVKLFSLATGVEANENDLLKAAQRVRTLERALNVTRGVTKKDDTLPSIFFDRAVPSGRYKGARLSREEFGLMVDGYYSLSGWNQDGVPKLQTFEALGLSNEYGVFKRRLNQEVKISD